MGVCDLVAHIADAVAAARQPLTPTEACWVYVLRSMPLYRDIKRLDLWEAASIELEPLQPSTVTEELLVELQMLGRCNLYQAFQQTRTKEYYARLVPVFAQAGVTLPETPDLSGW